MGTRPRRRHPGRPADRSRVCRQRHDRDGTLARGGNQSRGTVRSHPHRQELARRDTGQVPPTARRASRSAVRRRESRCSRSTGRSLTVGCEQRRRMDRCRGATTRCAVVRRTAMRSGEGPAGRSRRRSGPNDHNAEHRRARTRAVGRRGQLDGGRRDPGSVRPTIPSDRCRCSARGSGATTPCGCCGIEARSMVTLQPEPPVLGTTGGPGPVVAVLAEPDHDALTRELCGAAARLAESLSGSTVLLAPHRAQRRDGWLLGGGPARVHRRSRRSRRTLQARWPDWARAEQPWAILAGSTTSGREIAARVAAAIGAGLTGDAVDLEVADGRLVAWKPAFGGLTRRRDHRDVAGADGHRPPRCAAATAAARPTSPRSRRSPRPRRDRVRSSAAAPGGLARASRRGRCRHRRRRRRHAGGAAPLRRAVRVAGRRDRLHPKGHRSGGWMPHSSQIGITGRSISPRLYVAIGNERQVQPHGGRAIGRDGARDQL